MDVSESLLLFFTVNGARCFAEEAFKECVTLETKIQLLQKAAFQKVDIEKGLAAFKVRQQASSVPAMTCIVFSLERHMR